MCVHTTIEPYWACLRCTDGGTVICSAGIYCKVGEKIAVDVQGGHTCSECRFMCHGIYASGENGTVTCKWCKEHGNVGSLEEREYWMKHPDLAGSTITSRGKVAGLIERCQSTEEPKQKKARVSETEVTAPPAEHTCSNPKLGAQPLKDACGDAIAEAAGVAEAAAAATEDEKAEIMETLFGDRQDKRCVVCGKPGTKLRPLNTCTKCGVWVHYEEKQKSKGPKAKCSIGSGGLECRYCGSQSALGSLVHTGWDYAQKEGEWYVVSRP